MSCELIEDLEDENGTSLGLTMKANGHAFLMIGDDGVTYFSLPPDQRGFQAAETIERDLKAWREHVKENL